MMSAAWWVLQAATAATLLACAGLGFASSGRVGRHTPYGGFLFTISLGFWFLLCGNLTYQAQQGVGAWTGPPGWGDAFTLAGWALLVVAFLLLLLRFPPHPAPASSRTAAPALAGGLALGALPFLTRTLAPGPWDAELLLRAAYLFLDGVVVSVFILSAGILRRLRQGTLGRLYLLLGISLTLKTLGDLYWLAWPTGGPLGLGATAIYPTAGLIAVVALAHHHHAIRHPWAHRALADPSLVTEQLILRDAARQLKGLAGDLGERLVLGTGQRTLSGVGIASQVREGVLHALAPEPAWQQAVSAARERAAAVLGRPAEDAFATVTATYRPTEAPA